MQETTDSAKMRLELPAEMNDLILAYKRALKRNTGATKNKDEIILEILENQMATLKQKIVRLDAEYNRQMKALAKK